MAEMWSFVKHTLRNPILWCMIVLAIVLIPTVFILSYIVGCVVRWIIL
jgi:hypothetical protein